MIVTGASAGIGLATARLLASRGAQVALVARSRDALEKLAKIIAAEGELLSSQKLGEAADIMAAHPIALQLRNLQTMAEISVEKNFTIIFPAQLMSTIKDLNRFIAGETGK